MLVKRNSAVRVKPPGGPKAAWDGMLGTVTNYTNIGEGDEELNLVVFTQPRPADLLRKTALGNPDPDPGSGVYQWFTGAELEIVP